MLGLCCLQVVAQGGTFLEPPLSLDTLRHHLAGTEYTLWRPPDDFSPAAHWFVIQFLRKEIARWPG